MKQLRVLKLQFRIRITNFTCTMMSY